MAYSIDFRKKVVMAYLNEEDSMAQLAHDFRIARRTLWSWVRLYRETGQLAHSTSPGRPLKYPHLRTHLKELALEFFDASEQELAHLLLERHQIELHPSVVGYHLRQMGLTFKKTYRAREQDQERVKTLTEQFWHQLKDVPLHRRVFVDECGCQHNMSRTHGRSPRGQRVNDVRPGDTRSTLTVLGVLTIHGLVDAMTIDSGTDTQVFETFVEQVMCKHLEEGDVVVMDNLSAHKSAKVKALIEAAGARLLFQPPYSPQLNPIEMAWSKLKAFLRAARVRSREQIETVIKESLIKLDYSDAQGWFKACGHA